MSRTNQPSASKDSNSCIRMTAGSEHREQASMLDEPRHGTQRTSLHAQRTLRSKAGYKRADTHTQRSPVSQATRNTKNKSLCSTRLSSAGARGQSKLARQRRRTRRSDCRKPPRPRQPIVLKLEIRGRSDYHRQTGQKGKQHREQGQTAGEH